MPKFNCGVWGRLLALVTALVCVPILLAQSTTTGAISGTVTDQSGAIIQGAKVTAVDVSTGATHSTISLANGTYLLPLLEPGTYSVTFEKQGFQTAKQATVELAVSQTVAVNMKLQVGSNAQTVEVSGLPPLIEPENANTTTVLTPSVMDRLPNPGNDLSQFSEMATGAQIGVQSSGSSLNNVYINGVTGATVQYTLDGMDDDDPYYDQNNSGASDIMLGQNAVSEISINTNAYETDQGRLAAGSVNMMTKSGTNTWHGNLKYEWNGRALNAYDTFTKSTASDAGEPVPTKPFDNVNQWAGSVGGPIFKNKLFFYFDNEGIRLDFPYTASNVKVPSPAFEAYALCENGVATGNYTASQCPGEPGFYDTSSSTKNSSGQYYWMPTDPNNAKWLQTIFNLYGNTAVGTLGNKTFSPNPNNVSGCPLQANGELVANFNPEANYTGSSGSNPIPSGSGCYNLETYASSNKIPETYSIFRMDYNLNQKNTFYGTVSYDVGTQATSTSPINTIFNEDSVQPDWQSTLDWTHVFTPNLTNDASVGSLWYGALFGFVNQQGELAALDSLGEEGSPFGNLGSTGSGDGRNVTQYQSLDNLVWTHGTHSFKFGENFRRELVTDVLAQPYADSATADYMEMIAGEASTMTQGFPVDNDQQFKYFSLDMYAMDTWRATHNLTVTYGIRATHNSNIYDKVDLLSHFPDFADIVSPSSVNTPVNAGWTASNQLWNSVPLEIWQPRAAIAWQLKPNTLFKAGWGMFSQAPQASLAGTLAAAAPFDPRFSGGIAKGNIAGPTGSGGCPAPVAGSAWAAPSSPLCASGYSPLAPDTALQSTAAANEYYQSDFSSGAPSCEVNINPATGASYSTPVVNPLNCITPFAATALPAGGLLPEEVYQYSASLQRQLGNSVAATVGYVGTRSQHLQFDYNDDGYQELCPGCYAPYVYSPNGEIGSPIPRFSGYTQYRYDGYSNYNALQATLTLRHWHGFTLQANYAYSKCMTTGTPYQDGVGSSLAATYEDCTIDLPQALTVSYSYDLPFHKSGIAGLFTNGWQIAGATFSESGSPVFASSESLSGYVFNNSGPNPAIPLTPAQIGTAQTILSNQLAAHGSVTEIPPTTVLSVNSPVYYAAGGTVEASTPTGDYQWTNPIAYMSTFDDVTGDCYNFATNSEANNAANCQFTNGNVAAAVRGPLFNWTNLNLMKETRLTEKINSRFGVQVSNLFNHPNYADPSITGVVLAGVSPSSSNPLGLNSSLTSGVGAINSLTGFSSSFIGNGFGDGNPRMMALTLEIIF